MNFGDCSALSHPHDVGPRLIFYFLDFRLSMEINLKGSAVPLFALFLGKPTRHKAGRAKPKFKHRYDSNVYRYLTVDPKNEKRLVERDFKKM